MGRYDSYHQFVNEAREELKIGGDVAKAAVWATLALAEATKFTEDGQRSVEITGSLTVDGV